MQIEFLQEGSADCPLIRIYGTNPAEFSLLLRAVQPLAKFEGEKCSLHELPGFHSVSSCELNMVASGRNEGVHRLRNLLKFTWVLTPTGLATVAGFIEPFTTKPKQEIFQWLSGVEAGQGFDVGSIAVLISYSADGSW